MEFVPLRHCMPIVIQGSLCVDCFEPAAPTIYFFVYRKKNKTFLHTLDYMHYIHHLKYRISSRVIIIYVILLSLFAMKIFSYKHLLVWHPACLCKQILSKLFGSCLLSHHVSQSEVKQCCLSLWPTDESTFICSIWVSVVTFSHSFIIRNWLSFAGLCVCVFVCVCVCVGG